MRNTKQNTVKKPTLYIVATPIGNLNDISPRALQTLKEAKYIACEDTRTSKVLLNHYDIDSSKLFSHHKFNELSTVDSVIQTMIDEDCDIALISDAGTPCINDPGLALVAQARYHGVKVVGIPGPCTVPLALSISGFECHEWAFLGFYPRERKQQLNCIKTMKNPSINTYVFFESPYRVVSTIQQLKSAFKYADCFVGRELTKMFEQSFSGNIDDVLEIMQDDSFVQKGEFVVVIQPHYIETVVDNSLSIESQLIDYVVKTNNTFREAVSHLAEKKVYSKKDIYAASLRLKHMLKNDIQY